MTARACFTTEAGREAIDRPALPALEHVVVCEGAGKILKRELRAAAAGGAPAGGR